MLRPKPGPVTAWAAPVSMVAAMALVGAAILAIGFMPSLLTMLVPAIAGVAVLTPTISCSRSCCLSAR